MGSLESEVNPDEIKDARPGVIRSERVTTREELSDRIRVLLLDGTELTQKPGAHLYEFVVLNQGEEIANRTLTLNEVSLMIEAEWSAGENRTPEGHIEQKIIEELERNGVNLNKKFDLTVELREVQSS